MLLKSPKMTSGEAQNKDLINNLLREPLEWWFHDEFIAVMNYPGLIVSAVLLSMDWSSVISWENVST